MCLDDAITLLSQNYTAYLAEEKQRKKLAVAPPPAAAVTSAATQQADDKTFLRPDPKVRRLIQFLADDSHLMMDEIEEIIVYLKRRQDELQKNDPDFARKNGMIDTIVVILPYNLEA